MAKKAGRAEDIADIPEDVQLSITRYLTTMTTGQFRRNDCHSVHY